MAVDELGAQRLIEYLIAPRVPRDNSLIRLSNAGRCSRQIGYVLIGADATPEEVPTLATFEIGHSYHRMAQEWLQQLGWLREEFTEYTMIDPGRRIRGTADGISERLTLDWQLGPEGTRRVFEIKSISDRPMEYQGRQLTGSFTRLKQPKEPHLDQATSYAAVWNEAVERGELPGLSAPNDRVTHLTFVYVCKDAGNDALPVKVFTQALSPKRWERLEAKYSRIWAALDGGMLPNRDEDPFSPFSNCKFCPFLTSCRGYEE
jgi:hypothetical protein